MGAVQGSKSLHHPSPRGQQGHPERGGEEPAGCFECGKEPVPRACIGAWRRCHRDGSGLPAHSEGKDLERCCPVALQGCCLSLGGDSKNSCTELWCQHHPLTHSIEGQARQGGGEDVNWGINGETGELADMSALGIWEPLSVKLQVFKTAIETAILLLRIDDIVSGSKKKGDVGAQGPAVDHGAAPPDMPEM